MFPTKPNATIPRPAGRRAARVAAPSIAVLAVLAATTAFADMELTAPDGRRVLLKDDQTWSYIDATVAAAEPDTTSLELVNNKAGRNSCRYGLKLSNTLDYEIKSLTPQFTAVTSAGVDYQTVFRSFSDVKATRSQYREIEFTGIKCAEIAQVRVSGADRCTMGELTKFSPEKGKCLAYVRVLTSDIVQFSK